MKTKKIIWILLLITILLNACGAGGQQEAPTPLPNEVDWPTAIKLLNTGDVEQVFQSHDLTVILTFKDGQEVKTIEPTIDAIFNEVQRCGAPCSNIILVTE